MKLIEPFYIFLKIISTALLLATYRINKIAKKITNQLKQIKLLNNLFLSNNIKKFYSVIITSALILTSVTIVLVNSSNDLNTNDLINNYNSVSNSTGTPPNSPNLSTESNTSSINKVIVPEKTESPKPQDSANQVHSTVTQNIDPTPAPTQPLPNITPTPIPTNTPTPAIIVISTPDPTPIATPLPTPSPTEQASIVTYTADIKIYGQEYPTELGSINWGAVYVGTPKYYSIMVQNTGNATVVLNLSANNWSNGVTASLLWDYNGTPLKPNEKVFITLILNILKITYNNFSVDIVITSTMV